MAVEHPVVVACERRARPLAERLELRIAQRPAQLAVHVGRVGLLRAGASVGGQHAHLVAALAEVLDGGAPDELVAAVVVRGVHVPYRQHAHGGEDKVRAPVERPVAVSVVVASHARHLRLRWLLNALEEQTLPAGRWEAVVVHDYPPDTAARVIERHPLAEAGVLRHETIEPGTGSPSRQRNIGWRVARGELIAFTDDDCRPEPEWLERLVEVARANPGQIVQGKTRGEPYEREILRAPHVRTLWIDPVGPYAQTANILYPRALLERLGGFDERAIAGEDVGLSLRARRAGATVVAAPDAIVNHAIESHTLPGILRQNLKWRHLAYLAKQHPEMRREFPLRIFWDADHLRTTVALAGVIGAARRRPLLALAAPYVAHAMGRRGDSARGRVVAAAELPGQAVRQVAEVLGLVAGSVRHRTLLL